MHQGKKEPKNKNCQNFIFLLRLQTSYHECLHAINFLYREFDEMYLELIYCTFVSEYT